MFKFYYVAVGLELGFRHVFVNRCIFNMKEDFNLDDRKVIPGRFDYIRENYGPPADNLQ